MRPTSAPIPFRLELEREDEHSCRVRVYDGRETAVLLYEVCVASECSEDAQRRALVEVARNIHWQLREDW